MGQQQLFLLVLSVIIVATAIAVGLNIFYDNSVEANRQSVISDLVNYASKAQRYYRTSTFFGGGAENFDKFYLHTIDTGNGNGSYSLATSAPAGQSYVPGSSNKVTGTSGTVYILGCGKEIGLDRTNPVKAYVIVTPDSIKSIVLN